MVPTRTGADIDEGHAGLLRELLAAQDLLKQCLLEWFPCVAPQPVLATGLGYHHPAQRVLGWGPDTTQLALTPRLKDPPLSHLCMEAEGPTLSVAQTDLG